jgi:glucose-6-phosphate 1-epimerase
MRWNVYAAPNAALEAMTSVERSLSFKEVRHNLISCFMLESIQFPKYNAQIFLQGAHLTSFKDWLFLSPQSNFIEDKPIRGGVPIVFPYFGHHKTDTSSPQHGFARTMPWKLESQHEDGASLSLVHDGFSLQIQYEFGDTLKANLSIENIGECTRNYEVALHTYFAVSDIRSVVIKGIDGKEFLDNMENLQRKTQAGDLTFSCATDRIYLDCGAPISISDSERTLQITGNSLWKSTIIWNPFKDLADLGDDHWKRFVCVESGAVAENQLTIEAGGRHDLSIEISQQ